MNENKREKAEILLEGIGEIDDSLLVGALAYRKRGGSLSKLMVLAAAVAVLLTLTVAGTTILRLADGAMKNEAVAPETGDEAVNTLDSLLTSASGSDRFDYVEDESELPYIDSCAHIVWQNSNDSGYYVSDPVSDAELDRLIYQLGRGEEVGDDSPELECMVWVLLGDGRVISPYLKASAGNVSSEVFDYEAEIAPDERLVNTISGILS